MTTSRVPMRELQNILAAKDDGDVFPELALTLFVFIRQLHHRLRSDGFADVFFLSREGQLLLALYEMYVEATGGPHARGCYLEVSRRSTLLPSLGPLGNETFDTLFRQYRAISMKEFLASLGVDDKLEELAHALAVPVEELKVRRGDLPTDRLFLALLANETFGRVYERARNEQSDAFLAYFRFLLRAGADPSRIAVVDVGWKGTIQDNLSAILAQAGVRELQGFYLGLVAAGRAGPANRKTGLLFSMLPARTPGYACFNENRALFEVMLAADHPSVWRYRSRGAPGPVYGPFEEEAMIRTQVLPLQQRLRERFMALLSLPGLDQLDDCALMQLTIRFHARMVFNPRQRERAWFSNIFHVENFGVFEHSHFAGTASSSSLMERARFCYRLLLRKQGVELGFWPYKTLLEQAGYPAALAYSVARRLQSN